MCYVLKRQVPVPFADPQRLFADFPLSGSTFLLMFVMKSFKY
jgi:hypothetical protein